MSTSRLLITFVVLTALFAAGKTMVQRGWLTSALNDPDVRTGVDHGGGTAPAVSTGRLHRLEIDMAALRTDVKRIAGLEGALVRLENRIAALGAALAEQTEQEAYVDSAALQQPAEAHPPPEEGLPDEDSRLAAMRSAFLNDTIDPQWAMESSDLVTGFFEKGGGNAGTLRAVDCRSQYCRVAVGHESRAAADKMAMLFAMHVAGELPEISYHYERQSDGYTDVIMYLARPRAEGPSEG